MLAIVNGAVVVLAIGILIFVHELGHFLVAKKVGIRVEAFALGFGPKVWGFTRGDTIYKLCLIPLGGYVKMSGEAPEDRPEEVRGDEFFAKTISQRAWVVSAGVIMNVLFAIIAFPLAFAIGVPIETAVVGNVTPGLPAWEAGIESGDEILTIDDTEMLGFPDVKTAVAFSDEPLEVVLRRGEETLTRTVTPLYSEAQGYHVIGIGPEISAPRFMGEDAPIMARLPEGTVGPRDTVTGIDGRPVDAAVASGLIRYADRDELELEVEDARGGRRRVVVPLTLADEAEGGKPRIGVVSLAATIDRIANSPRQSDLGRRLGLVVGDRIAVLNGRPIRSNVDLDIALRGRGAGAARKTATVERDGAMVELGPVDWDGRPGSLAGSVALRSSGTHVSVEFGSPAYRAGMRSGDRVLAYGDSRFSGAEGDWKLLVEAIGSAGDAPRDVEVRRGDETILIRGLKPGPIRPTLLSLSLEAPPMTHEVHRPFPSSVSAGFAQTKNKLVEILMTLRGLFTGGVAAENLGGIITIARVSYTFAEQGLGKILFFMAILSLNLAILNILPIPILDGGHLVFLALEKIKGGPIDERWMGYANVVGLVFILGLMLFVTYNDIMRLVAG